MLGIVQNIHMDIPKLGARIAWIQIFWKYHYLNEFGAKIIKEITASIQQQKIIIPLWDLKKIRTPISCLNKKLQAYEH